MSAKRVYETKMEDRNRKGRSIRSWNDAIKEEAEKRGMQ